jgi:hypothetical protein
MSEVTVETSATTPDTAAVICLAPRQALDSTQATDLIGRAARVGHSAGSSVTSAPRAVSLAATEAWPRLIW